MTFRLWQCLILPHRPILPHCHCFVVATLSVCQRGTQCLGVQHCISQDCRRRLILPDFPRGAFEVLSPPSCGGQCTTHKRRRRKRKKGDEKERKGERTEEKLRKKKGKRRSMRKEEEEEEILRGAPPPEKKFRKQTEKTGNKRRT